VLLRPEDARKRRIEGGDRVRGFKDVGSFDLQAKVAPAMRPGASTLLQAPARSRATESRAPGLSWPQPCGRDTTPGSISSLTSTGA